MPSTDMFLDSSFDPALCIFLDTVWDLKIDKTIDVLFFLRRAETRSRDFDCSSGSVTSPPPLFKVLLYSCVWRRVEENTLDLCCAVKILNANEYFLYVPPPPPRRQETSNTSGMERVKNRRNYGCFRLFVLRFVRKFYVFLVFFAPSHAFMALLWRRAGG